MTSKPKKHSRSCYKCRCRSVCGLHRAIEQAIDKDYDGLLAYHDETGNAARNVPGCKSQVGKVVAGACVEYVKKH